MTLKRQLIIDDYKTAETGLWTLSSCKITKATQVQNFVSVPGRFSPLDLSTASSDGVPYYGNASLDAVLESSEGTRAERAERITKMINRFDGYSVQITHPDFPNHYLVGRIQVTKEYNDPVHCAVKVSAVCEPWLYNANETVVTVTLTTTEQTAALQNAGRLAVVPKVDVTGEATLTYGTITQTLSTGTYYLPDLYLTPDGGPLQPAVHNVSCSGSGTVTFTYREAVLAE